MPCPPSAGAGGCKWPRPQKLLTLSDVLPCWKGRGWIYVLGAEGPRGAVLACPWLWFALTGQVRVKFSAAGIPVERREQERG